MEIILFILTGFLLGWFVLKPIKDSIVKSYEKELTELKKEIIELKRKNGTKQIQHKK